MAGIKDWIQWTTRSGDPLTVGDVTITPQSQALTIRGPFGGFVWNRPVAVLVEREEGVERVPIIDVTRLVRWSLVAMNALFLMLVVLPANRKRSEKHE
jgi:hypothetical protein